MYFKLLSFGSKPRQRIFLFPHLPKEPEMRHTMDIRNPFLVCDSDVAPASAELVAFHLA